MHGLPNTGVLRRLAGGTGLIVEVAEFGHVLYGDLDGEAQGFTGPGVDDGYGPKARARGLAGIQCRFGFERIGEVLDDGFGVGRAGMALSAPASLFFGTGEKTGHFLKGALGSAQADALHRVGAKGLEAFQRKGQVSAALGGHQGMDLVDDDGVDGAQRFGGAGGQQEVERLRGGDEDLARMTAETGTLLLGGIAGANADFGYVDRHAVAPGEFGHAGEWGAQVPLHVHGEGLQGGYIEDAATWRRRRLAKHESVDAPEEGRKGLSRAGWSEDQGGLAPGNGRPSFPLGRGDVLINGAEPIRGDRVKQVENRRGGDAGSNALSLITTI